MHICWGNYEGPHTRDIPLYKVLPALLKVKPMGLLIEGAQSAARARVGGVQDARSCRTTSVLVPGVLDTTTQLRRASGAGRATDHALRRARGSRTSHGRHGLRLRPLRRLRRRSPVDLLGQDAVARRRRAHRDAANSGAAAPPPESRRSHSICRLSPARPCLDADRHRNRHSGGATMLVQSYPIGYTEIR